jgi:hypothetical protein
MVVMSAAAKKVFCMSGVVENQEFYDIANRCWRPVFSISY